MDAYKQEKELEWKVHEALFINLSLLSDFYPTSNEFNAIIRKDMFVKNNKAAFFEVIHYLLSTLNADLTKKTLLSWPPYDLKREAKFRSELIAYINTLNGRYESADIPLCQASSLISPGGFRFAVFMLKISQLVVVEHLKKKQSHNLIHRMKINRNLPLNAQKSFLEKETKLIEWETKELLDNFNKKYLETTEKSVEISKKLAELNKDIQNARGVLEKTQEEFNTNYPSYPSLSVLEEKLLALKQQIDKVLELDRLFSSSEKLLNYLSGSTMTLAHDKENFIVPSDIAHIVTNRKELDLCQFFEGLVVLLEKKALQLQSPSLKSITDMKEGLQSHSEKVRMVLRDMELEQEQLNIMLDEMREALHGGTRY